jgi:hypothetical protein
MHLLLYREPPIVGGADDILLKMDESFADSTEISNFKNTHLFFRGIDRGGDDLADMLQCRNRLDGNSGECYIPTLVLEKGSEKCSKTLKQQLLKKRET